MAGQLAGKVAVVAGSARGAGRAIAHTLGTAGATVYCTGRSARGTATPTGRPETIDDTADLITQAGGTGIALAVDYTDQRAVDDLFARVQRDQGGVDILVNNVNGDDLAEWGGSFWEQSLENGLSMIRRGVDTHIRTARAAVPMMLTRTGNPLIVGITDRGGINFYHAFVKQSVMKIAELLAPELRSRGVAIVALSPGYLRSEMMLERFGVTEANWRDAVAKDPFFAASETPYFVARAVLALATDRRVLLKTGKSLASWELAQEYGFTDVDGTRPNWTEFVEPRMREGWPAFSSRFRAEFRGHGVPDDVLAEDAASYTLSATLDDKTVLTHTLSLPELVFQDPETVAAEFYQRYVRLR
jgi:NAD(P)-dependent dehydrogenase (short-subunit alcohol dehydrogenase family)